ncbi:MAG: 3-oxoacyl-[acyl-carrier-protein] synthase [Frankiaceae bacterium]|nr:3-oxoacyl-[acyl-carrier-protein] synthase [Frankiaceae bacterium]
MSPALATRAPREAALLAVGEHRSAHELTNADLAARLDTCDEWIRRRTGIRTRRVAAPEESIVAMGVDAGAKALATAGVDPASVDLVILATCTAARPIPGLAPQVASQLGALGAGAFDVNGGCAGFCYSLAMAADTVRAGSAETVLVVASERLTDWVDADDRSMVVLFGDGAGAAVVGAVDAAAIGPAGTGAVGPVGIGPVAWGHDGANASVIEIREEFLQMQGTAVFRWATTSLVPVARRACELAGIEPADLAALVPHQANLRILESMARTLGAPDAVLARDVVDNGNTSAASVPLALARLVGSGEVESGDLALLFGFGAGLTYAGQVVRIP